MPDTPGPNPFDPFSESPWLTEFKESGDWDDWDTQAHPFDQSVFWATGDSEGTGASEWTAADEEALTNAINEAISAPVGAFVGGFDEAMATETTEASSVQEIARGPAPVPLQAPVPAVRSDGQAPVQATVQAVASEAQTSVPPPRGDGHVGAGIRKRPFKCAYCHSTFSSVARRTAHVEKNHADKLASSAGSSAQTPQN